MKRNIALLLCAVFCSATIFGQGRIDKVIDSMEGKPDVETTYTERRSPKKKKLIATSRIFNFENTYYFEKLRKAFEEERNNSVSAVKTKNQMTYRFDDNKSVCTYTLSWSSDRGPFTMVMTWRSSEAKDSSYLMDGELNELNFESGYFSMSVDELLKELNMDNSLNSCIDGHWSISRDGQVIEIIGDQDNNDIIIRTIDDYGCPVSMSYGSDDYFRYVKNQEARCEARKQAAKARQEAAKARKQAAEARQEAAKVRREAAKARTEARREAAKARAEAQKAAAKARREASKARRASLNSDQSEKIYELASRSRCIITSPSGVLTEMNALDALDNDVVWSALEDAVDSGKRTITTTTISGSTTTVIIEPEPEKI